MGSNMCWWINLCICVFIAIVVLVITIPTVKTIKNESAKEISEKLLATCLSFIVKMTIIIVAANLVDKLINSIYPTNDSKASQLVKQR